MAEETKKNDGTPKERRQFPRLNSSADVEYTILKKGMLPGEKTATKNISAGGICLIVYEKIGLGSLLALSIHFIDIDYVLEAKGRVIWSSSFTVGSDGRERYDLGIEFTEMDESDRQKISQYIFRLIK